MNLDWLLRSMLCLRIVFMNDIDFLEYRCFFRLCKQHTDNITDNVILTLVSFLTITLVFC